jgi:hypothetical protein
LGEICQFEKISNGRNLALSKALAVSERGIVARRKPNDAPHKMPLLAVATKGLESQLRAATHQMKRPARTLASQAALTALTAETRFQES